MEKLKKITLDTVFLTVIISKVFMTKTDIFEQKQLITKNINFPIRIDT